MKHQNPAMNATLEEARELRNFLQAVGFPVRSIECDPTAYGQRSSTMVPEDNIPNDGEKYSLVYLFDGSGNRDYHQVTAVREIVTDHPDLRKLHTLFGVVWPNGAQSDFYARVMRHPNMQQAINVAILELLPKKESVEKTSEPEPPKQPTVSSSRPKTRK